MNNYQKNRGRFTLLILIICLFSVSNDASALSLSPVRIEISGNPGETVTKEMVVTNESEGNSVYYSSYSNFEASGDTGSPSFVEPKNDIGTWMSTTASIDLKAKEAKTISFSIEIPKDAEPGGHFGAIFWGTNPNGGSSGVAVGSKTGILVLLSVNGDVKEDGGLVDFKIKDNKIFYNTLPVSFTYRFRNDGGDRIKPVGKIVMHDLFYIPEDKIDANLGGGNVLPSSTRRFNVDWVKNPRLKDYVAPSGVLGKFFDQAVYQWNNYAFGPYFAKLSLLYGTDATRVNDTVFFFVFPWQLIICLLIILIIVFWGGKKLIKRYNRHIIQKARAGMNTPNDASHV